jgi:hypothetical protein
MGFGLWAIMRGDPARCGLEPATGGGVHGGEPAQIAAGAKAGAGADSTRAPTSGSFSMALITAINSSAAWRSSAPDG